MGSIRCKKYCLCESGGTLVGFGLEDAFEGLGIVGEDKAGSGADGEEVFSMFVPCELTDTSSGDD